MDVAAAELDNDKVSNDEMPQIKVTVVSKLQEELIETPVSSAGEDDDVKDFYETLKDDPSWDPPPSELEVKIRTLIEHYFSDENLVKDKFLLKHVKRNRLGYVSVKLLTSFKKIKNLSKSDWKITAYSLSKSEKLELNKSGTKVRRKDPLPEIDLPITSIRTLLYKLSEELESLTVDKISEQFQPFGELTTVRIIRPDVEVPVDLRNHMGKHPELGTRTCVVVEYESTEAAQSAYKTLSKQARDENKPDMYSLLGSGRNPRKHAARAKPRDGLHYDSSEESPYFSSRENSPMMRRKFMSERNEFARNTSPLISPQGSRDTSPNRSHNRSPRGSPLMPRKNAGSGVNNRNSPLSNRKPQPKHVTHGHHQKTSPLAVHNPHLTPGDSASGGNTPTSGSSPWLQRRRQFVASQGNSPASTPGSSPVLGRKFQNGVPVGVIRLPKGPPKQDSKGFDSSWRQHAKSNTITGAERSQGDVKETPAS